jgi:hypothetical protein
MKVALGGFVSIVALGIAELGFCTAGCFGSGDTGTSLHFDAAFPDIGLPDIVFALDSGLADGLPDGPVATPPPDYLWYVLDETQGTTAHDSSSHHFDVTNLVGVTWNQGANFDGVDGGGVTKLDSAYRVPPITISAWLTPNRRTDSPTSYSLQPYPPNAVSDDIPAAGGFGIGLNVWSTGSALAAEDVDTCNHAGLCVANSTQNAQAADGGPSCTSATACDQGFAAGTEHFVAVAVAAMGDGGPRPAARVYVDGLVFDDTLASVPGSSSTAPFYLGCHNADPSYGTTRVFDGRIRDVRVYKRELAQPEIVALYLQGPTLQAPAQPRAPAPDAGAD